MELWAIVNLTPDSFYQDSRVEAKSFVERVLLFLQQGAHKLDIGAESTRPGGRPLTPQEEWQRLEKPLKDLKSEIGEKEFRRLVSIDTRHPQSARHALELGVGIINDVSGGNKEMFATVAAHQAQIVIMHSTSLPVNPSEKMNYNDVVEDVFSFLRQKSLQAQEAGVLSQNIIWDYGIGFGKDLQENLRLLTASAKFRRSGYRLMAGISRKSFLHKLLDIPETRERLMPTMIVSTYLALQGVDILRTHDIKPCVQMNALVAALNSHAE